MQNIGHDDDPDQRARNQAALAAQARARQAAGGIAQAHADQAYEQARQSAVGYVPPATAGARVGRLSAVYCSGRVSTVAAGASR